MDTTDTVGTRIVLARKQKGMTQRDLAAACHVQQSAIARWENDRRSPNTNDIVNLAWALGIDVLTLIPGQTLPQPRLDTNQLATKLRHLLHDVTHPGDNNTPPLTWSPTPTPRCTPTPRPHWHTQLHTNDGSHHLATPCFDTIHDALTWGRTHLPELPQSGKADT